jgi:hypothetical protein
MQAMPKRYGKGLMRALIAAAKRQLSHNMRTEFSFETPAQHTRLQKAIRHLCRREIAAAANLYAKRIDPEAHGLVLYEHTAKGFPAYEIEVLDADGVTLATDTVGHAWLMALYQQSGGAV